MMILFKYLKPRISLFFIFVFVSTTIYGQIDEDRKLYDIWSDTTKSEILRLDAYFQRLNNFDMFRDANKELKWHQNSNEAIRLAIMLNKKEYLPLLFLSSSFNYGVLQDNPEQSCTEALKVIESAKIANASINAVIIALINLYQDCPSTVSEDDMIKEYNRLKNNLSTSSIDIQIQRNLNTLLGQAYKYRNQYPKALMHILESVRLSENLKIIDNRYAANMQSVADIHLNIGNFKEAKSYALKSLQYSGQIKDTSLLGGSYMLLSKLMLCLNDKEQSQHYIDSAIYIMREVKHCEPCLHFAKIINAGIKNLSGKYSLALAELTEVETFFKQFGHGLYPDFFIEKSKTLFNLGKYDDAIKVLNQSRELETVYYFSASEKYNILVKAYEAKKDYKKALENYKLFVNVEKSNALIRNSSETTRLELENQFTQEQLKSKLDFETQLNKQKSTRNWILFLGISAILIALGLYARLRYIRKTQKLLQEKNQVIEAEKQKAQASEKAKHQFLANMSHEIRTPMNAIKGMTDILIRRNPNEDQKEYLTGIKQSSDSLLVIINDILDISKIEAGKVELEQEPFSIHELVHNVHTIMHFKAEEKSLRLAKEIPTQELFVQGDSTRLRQILINLIGNAIKFTEKGMVTTTVKSEQEGEKLNLHFTISDTGIGIDQDNINKIFESFEQAYSDTTRKFGGTGLGLSISKKLVGLHGGKIWVESVKGKGSQFHFTIPYTIAESKEEVITPTNEVQTNNAEALKGIRILLVEDNAFNIVVATEELEDAIEGVIVEVAENGLIAVEKMKLSTFDIVLMDIQMPVMNGFEATHIIRNLDGDKANTPIIAMTANVLKEEVELCYKAGMNDFIGKPFDTEELLSKINNLVKK